MKYIPNEDLLKKAFVLCPILQIMSSFHGSFFQNTSVRLHQTNLFFARVF